LMGGGVFFFDNKTRSLRGQKGMVDAGESHRVQLPLNSGCDRFTHRGAAARFGNDPG